MFDGQLSLTREELIAQIAEALRAESKVSFGCIYNIEFRQERAVRGERVTGTGFEVAECVIREAGGITDGTVGSVMDALDIGIPELHILICYCKGEVVSGTVLAGRFEGLIAP